MSRLRRAIEEFPIRKWLESVGQNVSYGESHARLDCPHCGGRDHSLSVNLTTRFGQCFRCNEGGLNGGGWTGRGSLIALVCLLEGLDRREAVNRIFDLAGLDDDGPIKRLRTAPELGSLFRLTSAAVDHPSRTLLYGRGLGHLESRIYLSVGGRYSDRWILPCLWLDEVQGFEAKAWSRVVQPKSLFPSWFSSRNAIYTTPRWDWALGHAVITESIFDAETVGQNGVGIYGSVLHGGQFSRLLELRDRGIRRLVWFLDEDAFMKQARAVLHWTRSLFENRWVRVPRGEDPNSLGHDRCVQLVQQAEAVSDSLDIFLGLSEKSVDRLLPSG